MMRTRNLKPGYFKNEHLAECDPLARILFAGLWCLADREGRLEDRPKRIQIETLPYDRVNVDSLLDQLCSKDLIVRYEVDGQGYIQVINFKKHQVPHHKEIDSKIPPLPKLNPTLRQPRPNVEVTLPASSPLELELDTRTITPPLYPPPRGEGKDGDDFEIEEDEPEEPNEPGEEIKTKKPQKPDGLFLSFSQTAINLPAVKSYTIARKQRGVLALKEHPLEWWQHVFEKADKTPALYDRENNTGWQATYDWLIGVRKQTRQTGPSDSNAVKVIEGQCDGWFGHKTEGKTSADEISALLSQIDREGLNRA